MKNGTWNMIIKFHKKSIEKLNSFVNAVFDLQEQKLDLLIDVKQIFVHASLLQKRELIKHLFNNNLYYLNGNYLISGTNKSLILRKASVEEKGLFKI